MADAFGKFITTVSEDVDIPTCKKLCTYFGVTPAKTESILSNKPQGLALLNHLKSELKLTPHHVQVLHDAFMHINMVKAAQKVEAFARKIETRIPDSLDSDDDGDTPESSSDNLTFEDLKIKCGITKKLTLNEMLPIKDPGISLSLAEIFWTKITSLDYRITSSDLTNNVLSVRDLVFAILHSSDNLLRQDIIYKMSSCQLAVPLVVRSTRDKVPLFFYWAFRTIRKKYKGPNENEYVERPIFPSAIFTVSFLRIGDVRVSKSNLLNLLLSDCQGTQVHSFFTHKLNDVKPNFAGGSIEAVWYAPQGGDKELLEKPTTFLNLRGDSRLFEYQTEFILKVSNMIFVLIDKQNWQTHKDAIQYIKDNGNNVIVVAIRKTDEKGANPPFHCKHDGIIIARDLLQIKRLNELLCSKIDQIQKSYPDDNLLPIEAYKDTVKDFVHFDAPQVYLDELKNTTEKIVCGKSDIKIFKKRILALFPRWLKWTEIDSIPIKIDQGEAPGRKEKIALRIETQLEERKEQVKTELAEEVKQFWELLKLVDTNNELYDDCLVCLRSVLFDLTYEHKIGRTGFKSSEPVGEHTDLRQAYMKEAQDEWEMRIGLEDFMRELGQLFEAHMQCGVNSEQHDEIMRLPFLAAQFLIRGNSLEILDDKSYCIPQIWISRILAALSIILGEASKVMVLSVIGVQGSGKSTLLNSMFGTKFPVSAGRCTRGLFIRLLQVEESFSKDLGCRYIIVMDTEGLKADHGHLLLEKTRNRRLDNKMATLALCLADFTIVNIEGELVSSDTTDFLEIAAYAAIRMKEVDLKSQCRVIQQRVSDITAPVQNRNNMQNIIHGLDEALQKVAKAEGCIFKFKSFSDIFKLNIEEHTQYVPVLWSGNMNPPNPLYGEVVTKFKRQILGSIQKEELQVPSTFQTFCSKLLAVDTALKEENFVLNFENVSKAISCHDFSMQCNKWLGDVRSVIMDRWTEWRERLNTSVDCEREYVSQSILKEVSSEIDKQRQIVWGKFESYLQNNGDNKHLQNDNFRSWIELNLLDFEEEMKIKVSNYVKVLHLGFRDVPSIVAEMTKEIRLKAVQEATRIRKCKGKQFDHKHCHDHFEKFWDELRNDLLKKYELKQVSEKEIRTECSIFVQKLCTENAFESEFFHLLDSEGDISNHSKEFDYENYMPKKRTYQKGVWDAEDTEKGKQKSRQLKVSVERVKESILRQFAETSDQQKAFSLNLVYSTLQNALAEISGIVNEDNVKLPSSLVVKALLHICAKIAELASNSRNEHQRDSTSQELLDKQKPEIYLDFTSFFEEECQNDRAFQFICKLICEQFTRFVLQRLKVNIISHISDSVLQTKRKLHVEVLKDLLEVNDPLRYINYINNNTEFLINWLRDKMVHMISTKVGSKSWIELQYETVLHNIPAFRTSFVQELSTSQSMEEWCEKFTEFLSKEQGIKFELEETYVYRVSDMNKLSQNVTLFLQNILDMKTKTNIELPDPCSFDLCDKFLQLVLNCSFENLASTLLGCQAQCCICKAPCCREELNHQIHKVLCHYPRGLTGVKCESNKLDLEFCTGPLLAAENVVHYNKDGEFCVCKGFERFYSFGLPCRRNYRDEMMAFYWIRVFHLINSYCANYFRCKPADLPELWASDFVALKAKSCVATLSFSEKIKLMLREDHISSMAVRFATSDVASSAVLSLEILGRIVSQHPHFKNN